jgi:hypothetical protein
MSVLHTLDVSLGQVSILGRICNIKIIYHHTCFLSSSKYGTTKCHCQKYEFNQYSARMGFDTKG